MRNLFHLSLPLITKTVVVVVFFSIRLKVIYSAFGSFFIPMSIMLYVYSKIFWVLTSRQSRMSRTEVRDELISFLKGSTHFDCYRRLSVPSTLITNLSHQKLSQATRRVQFTRHRRLSTNFSSTPKHVLSLKTINKIRATIRAITSSVL